MKKANARTLRKREREELLSQAVRRPDYEELLALGENEIWELPDGRVIHVFINGGPAILWSSWKEIWDSDQEARAYMKK